MNERLMRISASMRALSEDTASLDALPQALRIAEALLFAAPEPLSEEEIARVLPAGVTVGDVLGALAVRYQGRGFELRRVAGKWGFRTAEDLSYLLSGAVEEPRRLSRAALETLAIIAYHQPVTRAEMEDIRGVATSRETLGILIETGWVKMRGRRRTPGRPVTYGTTEAFLVHFNLDRLSDLPGLDEMRGAGLVDAVAPGFTVPMPSDDPALTPEEDALEPDLFEKMIEDRLNDEEPPLDPDAEVTHR